MFYAGGLYATMSITTRREFTKRAFFGAAIAAVPYSRVLGANEDIRVAVIGINSKGLQHIKMLNDIKGCRVVALCDVDPKVLASGVSKLKAKKISVFATTDAREIMDRDDIDAVSIATADHWHALLTIWACQAGKDVYVEKPISHSISEGRMMITAAEKYNRIVQSGTQSRSCTALSEIVPYVQAKLGKINYVHSLWYRYRSGIAKAAPWRPDWLDYDMYCGPSPNIPLTRNDLHYDWRWMWDTGTGELGNLGAHYVDVARWFIKSDDLPKRVMSVGGRYAFEDTCETPNTQFTLFDFAQAPVIMETRNLPMRAGLKAMDNLRGIRSGLVVQCEKGYFAGSRGGGMVYDNDGKRIKKFSGNAGAAHHQNFIDAVRSRKTSDLKAPLDVGHKSNSACLLGNISYRLGKQANIEQIKKQIAGHAQGVETLERIEKHLAANDVDLSAKPLISGPWLDIDTKTGQIAAVGGRKDSKILKKAADLVRGNHRKPYVAG
jgi:predicted dehydrogenase